MADMKLPLLSESIVEEKYRDFKNVSDANSCVDNDGNFQRTGNLWTAGGHIITAVIGSGILSLAWCMAQLGWIAGIAAMLIFSAITYYTSCLLADCYRSGHPTKGKRNPSYIDAVRANLGKKQIWLCGLVQYTSLYGAAIGYTITASLSMVAIGRSNCFHKNGHDALCDFSNNNFTILFGFVEMILSQIPNFDQVWWLSIAAAIMSFTYATIGLGLAVAQVVDNREIKGSLGGVSIGAIGEAEKVWVVFQALGDIAFAYSFSVVLIEIQDTLKSPPAENITMKRASLFGVSITIVFYILCACFGYAAFGNNAPENLLTSFGFYEPYWLIDFGNACVAFHLLGAYQVYCQPVFAFIEQWFSYKCPNSRFINDQYGVHIPFYGMYNINFFRLIWRTAFVVSTTSLAILFPFFNDVLGILGAMNFWPLTVYFPVEMYIAHSKIQRWTTRWIFLQTLSFVCFLVSLTAAVGSIEGVVESLKVRNATG